VIVQKFMEKGSDSLRQSLIEKVAPRMASLGIHKNGTWAVQKIIDEAKTPKQVAAIVECLRIYAPALLMDQFGNYVIQCCLRLGSFSNQFIFDAIASRVWEIGQNRFGARATKACLENEFTTQNQQKQVSLAIVQSCVQLSMNANGSILVTWLLDSSMIPGRYRVVAPTMIAHLKTLGCHKIASQSLFKIGKSII
jgi:Pumilio-family RNA binding repeat